MTSPLPSIGFAVPAMKAATFPLVDEEALGEGLRAIADDPALSTPAAVAAIARLLKRALEEARGRAEAALMTHATGLQVARSMARFWDGALRCLLAAAGARTRAATDLGSGFALAAVGGYGRGALAPYSDLDLLFIVRNAEDPQTEQAIHFVLYALWDAGVKVGQATRTQDECIADAARDMTIRTNILEARFLAGDETAFAAVSRRFWDEIAPSITTFVAAKLAEREARHAREGNSRYRVEPNIKDGKGGLRDLHTLLWIAKYVFHAARADLVRVGLLTRDEYGGFIRCAVFLWNVRAHLHFLAGRAEERLTFNVQADMAKRLGYEDRPGLRGVEAFMKDYFLTVKEVGRFTGIIYTALELQNAKGMPGRPWVRSGEFETIEGCPGFVLDMGRLALAHDGVFEEDPANLLRLFALAHRRKLYVHPSALRVVSRSLHLIDDALRADRTANKIFLDLLCDERNPERILRRMNEVGVLGAFIPDFGRIVAMMQFNMYHHYTVDEHLIQSIGEIHEILGGSLQKEFPFGHRVAQRVRSRRALIVAMLLHDIAKGRDEDHSDAGARIAQELGARFGLTDQETDTVSWLVREHLILSDISQRRDIFDPKTARDLVAEIRTRERLRLLLTLTVADIRAVGPGTWSAWKAQLLQSLFLEIEARFGGGEHTVLRAARVRAVQDALKEKLPRWAPDAFARVVSLFDESYWLGVAPEHHARHARLLAFAEHRLAHGRSFVLVDAADAADKGVTRVTVVTQDRPGLFASLAGVFAAAGAYIVSASAFTSASGIVLDIFDLQAAQGPSFAGRQRFARLRERIRKVLTGAIALEDLGGRPTLPERQHAFTVRVQVHIDNEASITHTVMEVERPYRPDLLYKVAAALREKGLSIGSAHCTHYGELAVDVFYLKDRGGLKIIQPLALRQIKEHVVCVLNDAVQRETARGARGARR